MLSLYLIFYFIIWKPGWCLDTLSIFIFKNWNSYIKYKNSITKGRSLLYILKSPFKILKIWSENFLLPCILTFLKSVVNYIKYVTFHIKFPTFLINNLSKRQKIGNVSSIFDLLVNNFGYQNYSPLII